MELGITTERLRLVAGTPLLAQAELDGLESFAKRLGSEIPESWPPPLCDTDSMEYGLKLLEEDPKGAGWYSWYILLRNPQGGRTAIGIGGFKGRPSEEGEIELSYAILEDYQNQGFCTEAIKAWTEWAFQHPEVKRVVAETMPDLTPSIRVLEKNGFSKSGDGAQAGSVRFERLPNGHAAPKTKSSRRTS